MKQFNLRGAIYVDVNTRISKNNIPELIPDIDSVKWSALYNLFFCPVGARGPIFQPRFGSNLYYILQEPLDDESAKNLEIAMFDAIRTWEPRVEIDIPNSRIITDEMLPGYRAYLALIDKLTGKPANLAFDLRLRGR